MITLLTTGLLIYTGIVLFAWFFANEMIFQPPPSSYQDSKQIIKLNSGDVEISAIHLSHPQARYTILYSHGNAVDLGQLYPILDEIRAAGFSVFAYDYSGYGTSSGKPSEEHTYEDINAAYRYLTKQLQIPAHRIIALGQSLGGGVAADLASRKLIGGLILESTFVTAYRVLISVPLLPFDQFNNLAKLKQISCPVLVIHGRNDSVISFWHGKRLFEMAHQPKQNFWVEGAGHNNLLDVAGKDYGKTLHAFMKVVDDFK